MQKGCTGRGEQLPTSTSGGFLSFSHAGSCGIFTLTQLVDQLQHEAGERQVTDAKLAFLSGFGGADQAFCSAILGRV